ncbi:SHOCT domain-containing protein [Noviherbaspirillum sp. UKPF54]|uniref:SHOCT domain-containing protein n=1 Tax=Noviherbaspirillum sp. UKPF54 TaxID=2601898 RepID=UPI00143E0D12|nr:SHOCT domain-containing protein [Noviherbaspirillum sp. UKPF54]
MKTKGYWKFSVRKILALTLVSLITVGCAHPISVAPTLTNIENGSETRKIIEVSVGYYISTSAENLEVTTPGGGGDNIRYYPYKDIEAAYKDTLGGVFRKVTKVSTPTLRPDGDDKLDYVIEPTIVTNSGGSGFFTWPPTNFSVDITNRIIDSTGQLVASPRVLGIGTAETGERLVDHGIAGRRAMEDALSKMRASLLESKLGQKSTAAPVSTSTTPLASDVESRLARLAELKKKGLISPQEYEARRKVILESL